jgi:hypothetical protein
LNASENQCTAAALVDEFVAAKKPDGASQRHMDDLRSRLHIFVEKFDSQPVAAVIRVYDQAGNVIETHEHAGDFKEW